MSEKFASAVVIIGGIGIFYLCVLFAHKASKIMAEELEREKLRKATKAALMYDKHLAKLKRNDMRAHYRRARIW